MAPDINHKNKRKKKKEISRYISAMYKSRYFSLRRISAIHYLYLGLNNSPNVLFILGTI